MAGSVFAWFTLAAVGVIIADVLAHPEGVKAFGSSANSILNTTFNAMLGKGA